MRIAIYARVSTNDQTTENQVRELMAWATRCGHTVVHTFRDNGISGAKGRDKRPGFDQLLRAIARREIELVAVWSTDRLARSMPHLIELLMTLRETGVGLYINSQGIDTSTASGRALLQVMGVFAELEREMAIARIKSGMRRAAADGIHVGRPKLDAEKRAAIVSALALGSSDRKAAAIAAVCPATVSKVRRELAMT